MKCWLSHTATEEGPDAAWVTCLPVVTPPKALRAVRLAKGYSRGQLAALVRVSSSSVKAWEIDLRTPRPALIPRLADVLDVPISTLTGEVWSPGRVLSLRELRLARGLRKEEAAQMLGVDRRLLTRVEDGRLLPPDTGVWCRVYRVTPEDLARSVSVTMRAIGE